MELSLAQAALQADRTVRSAQLAVQSGELPALRAVGRMLLVDDLAVQAWVRSTAPGRTWAPEVREAALDLLSDGATDRLSSSERSRLRARLRTMTAKAIAHAAGGIAGGWARYRLAPVPALPRIGPSAVDLASLGVVSADSWLTFAQVASLDALENDYPVLLDADGNLAIVERPALDDRIARILLDTYLFGESRVSAAAGVELERRARHA